jgi:hypothetical protein
MVAMPLSLESDQEPDQENAIEIAGAVLIGYHMQYREPGLGYILRVHSQTTHTRAFGVVRVVGVVGSCGCGWCFGRGLGAP